MEGKQTAPVFFVSAVLCAILCAIFPFAGFVTVIVLPAVFGVCLAASFSLPVALSPLPGIVIAGLLWRSLSVSVCGLCLLIPAAVLCVCLRKKSSASVITLAAAVSYAAVFASALIAYALYNYGSLSAAADALVSFMSSYVDKLFAAATDAAADTAAGDALSSLTEQFSADAYVKNLTMLMPGAFLAACEVLGYLLSHAARLAIRILPVPIGLYPDKRNISLPASAAVLFLLSFAVTMFSGDGVVYFAAENLNTVLTPALFVVGLGAFAAMLRSAKTGKKVAFIIFLCILFFVYPAVAVYSVCAAGVISTIAEYFRRKRNG